MTESISKSKTVSFKTLGCRLNQAETAQIRAEFIHNGYQIQPFNTRCDIYVINSCTITKNAEHKSVRYARSVKKKNPNAIIILAGCAVEASKETLTHNADIDIFANQKEKLQLPALVDQYNRERNPVSLKNQSLSHTCLTSYTPVFTTTRALVKVQDGCDFNCTYCIVPQARGNPVSRSFDVIINEVKKLSDKGFVEIVLTGANLGRYKDNNKGLTDLLDKIEQIPNIKRIRLSSIELSTTETTIIDYMQQSEKLCHHIHIPLQSGDNNILKAMHRRYTSEQYQQFIEDAVNKIPLLGIGTDVLIGFPGEDDIAFNNTVKVIEKIPFNNLHIFPYSKRENTEAAVMPNQIDNAVKKERCAKLKELGKKKKKNFADKFIEQEVSVLIEDVDKQQYATGWTSEYLEAKIHIPESKKNDIISFRPSSYKDGYLV